MKNKKTNQNTANADMVKGSVTIGKWTIPPISLKSIILLEKIKSPFTKKRDPECPKCGAIFDDDRPAEDIQKNEPIQCPKCEKKFQIMISVTDLSETLYVLMNQALPNIAEIVDDHKLFQREVLKMADQMTMDEMTEVTGTINTAMTNVNELANDSSGPGGTEKNAGNGQSE